MRWLWAAWTFFLAVLLVVVPAAVNRGRQAGGGQSPRDSAAVPLKVSLYIPADQRLASLPLHEYLLGVVAAEMPPEFADEALKAQMVVARTYTVKHMRQLGGRGCVLHPEADACATPDYGQAYTTLDALQDQYGHITAYQYWNRLKEAEAATAGLIITYQGQTIDAVYHSSSARATESGAAYFGNEVPYLQSVADSGGRSAPRYEETIHFTPGELARVLGVGKVDPRSPLKVLAYTDSGRVARVEAGGRVFTGRELRSRLGLRSTAFRAATKNGEVYITTYGYGHGVGMSQYGANAMAREGAGYRDIISHYYQGVQIERIFAD